MRFSCTINTKAHVRWFLPIKRMPDGLVPVGRHHSLQCTAATRRPVVATSVAPYGAVVTSVYAFTRPRARTNCIQMYYSSQSSGVSASCIGNRRLCRHRLRVWMTIAIAYPLPGPAFPTRNHRAPRSDSIRRTRRRRPGFYARGK